MDRESTKVRRTRESQLRIGPWALGLLAAAILFMPGGWSEEETPIKPGDTLFVDVFRRPELSTTAPVDASGNLPVPVVGNVNVAGATEKEAAERVSNTLKVILKNPRVTVSHSGTRTLTGTRTSEMQTQVINLNNANAEKLAKSLEGMCSPGGNVGFDTNSNSLIITDTPTAIQNIGAAISQIDQMQSQVTQVRIDAKVADVQQGAMRDLGIRWFVKDNQITAGYYPAAGQQVGLGGQNNTLANEQINSGGSTLNGAGSTSRRFVNEPNFDRRLNVPVQVPVMGQMFFGLLQDKVDIGVLLDALVKDNKAELLASPWTIAVNHKLAEIKMTDEFPYTESSQTFGSTSFSVKFMDLGIKLQVTPHVYKDTKGPYVQLELKPEVSFASGMANGVPIRSVRSTNNTANVRDGQTLVIGGIVMNDERNVDQRVPGLGKIPLLGALFKHKERAKTRNELMIFVTPSIHEAPESITWDRMINLTGAAKQDLPSAPGTPASVTESRGKSRKE